MGKKTGPKGPLKPLDWAFLDKEAKDYSSFWTVAEKQLRKEGITRDGCLAIGEPFHKKIEHMQKRITRQLKSVYGKDKNYVWFRELMQEPYKQALRAKQREMAIVKGNVPMLKHLGEQDLGQSQKVENVIKGDDSGKGKPLTVVFKVAERKKSESRYE